MLDLKLIREKPEEVEKALARRHGNFPIRELVAVNEQHKSIQAEWELLNRRGNEISEQFKTGKLTKTGWNRLPKKIKEIKKRREHFELEARPGKNWTRSSCRFRTCRMHPFRMDQTNANVEVKKWGRIPEIASPKHRYRAGNSVASFSISNAA